MTNAEARFNKSHIRKVYACLAVTCHLHFWQNDRDFLRATVVTRGWNGYRNKSQHRKSTLEKKILPPFQGAGIKREGLLYFEKYGTGGPEFGIKEEFVTERGRQLFHVRA